MTDQRTYKSPTTFEKSMNRWFGFLVSIGIGPSYMRQLQVKGRKTGHIYSTVVSVIAVEGKQFLVAPRGRTQWVRNAESSGEVILKKGSVGGTFMIRALDDSKKPEVLRVYLSKFKGAVQRFFPIPPDSSIDEFKKIAPGYPVFELIPK